MSYVALYMIEHLIYKIYRNKLGGAFIMANRDELKARYEDALFALLMNEVMISEGQKVEIQRAHLACNSYPGVTKKLSHRLIGAIDRKFAILWIRSACKLSLKFFNVLSIISFTAMLCFGTAFAFSPVLRANTINLIIEVVEESTDYQFTTSDIVGTAVLPEFSLTWIPDGFQLKEQELQSELIYKYYEGTNENVFNVTVIHTTENRVSIDTEDAISQTIRIGSFDGILTIEDNSKIVTWIDDIYQCQIIIAAEGLDTDALLCIACGLIWNK